MSRRGLNLSVGILLLCAPAPPAQAWDFDRSGMYVGVGGSYALDMALEDKVEDELDALGYAIRVDVKNSPSIQGRLGWRFVSHFAAELQVECLFGFDTKVLGQEIAEHEMLTATLNAKVPLSTRDVQPYALVGMGVLYAELQDAIGAVVSVDDLGPALRAGGGLDFYFTESVVLNVEATYVLPFSDVEYLDYLSIGAGLQYRF